MKTLSKKLISVATSAALAFSMTPAAAISAFASETADTEAALTLDDEYSDVTYTYNINNNYSFVTQVLPKAGSKSKFIVSAHIENRKNDKIVVKLPDTVIPKDNESSYAYMTDAKNVVEVFISYKNSKGHTIDVAEYYVNLSNKKILDRSGRSWKEMSGTKGAKYFVGFSKKKHDVVVYNGSLKKVKTIPINKNANAIDFRYDETAKCFILFDKKERSKREDLTLDARCYNSKFKYLGKSLHVAKMIITSENSKNKSSKRNSVFDMIYDGKTLKPSFKLKTTSKTLKAGRDYKVISYKTKVTGIGLIVVKGMGSYYGKSEFWIMIEPRQVQVTGIKALKRGLKVSWKKMSKNEAGAYRVRIYSDKKCNHEVFNEYSYRSISNKASSVTIKGLESGKTYYVRVSAVCKAASPEGEPSKALKVKVL